MRAVRKLYCAPGRSGGSAGQTRKTTPCKVPRSRRRAHRAAAGADQRDEGAEGSPGGPLDRPAPSPVRLHPNLAEIYRAKVAEVHRALEDPSIPDEALGILRGAGRAHRDHPGEGASETIELVGAIVGMVALGNEKAALDARTACSVKVVTHAYNHRQFTLPPIPI
jgi:hypothetical protein